MSASVKFKWNRPAAQAVRDAGIDERVMKQAAQAWHRLYSEFVPTETGRLANDVTVTATATKGTIRHNAPYAANVYSGVRRSAARGKNPLASGYWDKAAESAGKKEALAGMIRAYIGKG
jgi:hypothetical protein